MPYTIEEHQHRLAAWAAGRAAVRGVLGAKVKRCRELLEACGLDRTFGISRLPPTSSEFDHLHNQLCKALIREAQKHNLALTYGRAAKLLNVYLKVRFVCGKDHADARIAFLHPPIDRVLLNALACADFGRSRPFWTEYANLSWSRFDEAQYRNVIQRLQRHVGESPLWTIEQYWPGNQ